MFDVQKEKLFSLYNCRQLSGFLNNSVNVYPVKLKIAMLYRMNNTFRNTVFRYLSMCLYSKQNFFWKVNPTPTTFNRQLFLEISQSSIFAGFLVHTSLRGFDENNSCEMFFISRNMSVIKIFFNKIAYQHLLIY